MPQPASSARKTLDNRAQDVNRKGGLLGRKVELVCIDDETNPKLVPGIYQRLLDDEKVDLLIGGYGDNSVSPAMPLVMERNRYFVALMAQHSSDDTVLIAFDQHLPAGQKPLLPDLKSRTR